MGGEGLNILATKFWLNPSAAHLDFGGCSFTTNLLMINLLSQCAGWQMVHSYILVKIMRYEQFHW